MPKVRVNDIEMNYELHGEGEPLVLIMGLTGSLEGWRPLLPAFAREYRVLIFDNRGAGLTDKPAGPYSMPMMADDAAGLMDALGIESRRRLRDVDGRDDSAGADTAASPEGEGAGAGMHDARWPQ